MTDRMIPVPESALRQCGHHPSACCCRRLRRAGGDAVRVIDKDEYGRPVSDRYRRLGADGDQQGIYVRFEPGFGLNVHIGFRMKVVAPRGTFGQGPYEYRDFEEEGMVLGIDGWERLGELVDEWRTRVAAYDEQEQP